MYERVSYIRQRIPIPTYTANLGLTPGTHIVHRHQKQFCSITVLEISIMLTTIRMSIEISLLKTKTKETSFISAHNIISKQVATVVNQKPIICLLQQRMFYYNRIPMNINIIGPIYSVPTITKSTQSIMWIFSVLYMRKNYLTDTVTLSLLEMHQK